MLLIKIKKKNTKSRLGYIHIYIYTCIYRHIHVHTHMCMHTHMYIHIRLEHITGKLQSPRGDEILPADCLAHGHAINVTCYFYFAFFYHFILTSMWER